ncbi:hypothetical protein OOU_Y34scaffold00288g12 [Pyricularia oryzae Y34]|uniref:Uncharacterized protein n=2 Tax=Pyricularia oryzae TaxID=318829 RepID=A0AA97P3G1_PYRO3|nr:hypothetical protein OOU_Y34scaffold00288g12 [Pyricularia oryzae Y34]
MGLILVCMGKTLFFQILSIASIEEVSFVRVFLGGCRQQSITSAEINIRSFQCFVEVTVRCIASCQREVIGILRRETLILHTSGFPGRDHSPEDTKNNAWSLLGVLRDEVRKGHEGCDRDLASCVGFEVGFTGRLGSDDGVGRVE